MKYAAKDKRNYKIGLGQTYQDINLYALDTKQCISKNLILGFKNRMFLNK